MSNPPIDLHQTPPNQGLLRSLMLMAWMVEARDPYTGGHLWRVARMAEEMGRSLGMPDKEVRRIALAGFLHDIGKIGIPDAVLRKPGKLDDDEYAVIKAHPAIGPSAFWPSIRWHIWSWTSSSTITKHQMAAATQWVWLAQPFHWTRGWLAFATPSMP